MKKASLLTLMIVNLAFIPFLFAQTESERKIITQNYNIEKLEKLSIAFSEQYRIEKQNALKYAREHNLDVIIEKENGGIAILHKVLEDGTPIYVSTFNDTSAMTINTNKVHPGGSNGLALSGKNIIFGIWDGGEVRASHQELAGRITQLDTPDNLNSHATHVSGTMIASGIDPSARGMSFEGQLLVYDFDNNISEIAQEAANGMLVSNHSYGLSPSSIPVSWFGAYLNFAADIDAITYNAQYFLPVFAAGNSNGALPPYNPTKDGYDLISGSNLAKNILSVANVKEVLNYSDASSVEIWNNSSWGPTDDGRIKPDISAKGRLTYSADSGTDDDYAFKTGTSMAAPAVSGSIGLLHEHYNNLYNEYLTAASMKALVIHTAREAGNHPGPDYTYGWGLMDTSAAADVITNNNFTSIIEENTLNDGDTYTISVNAVNPDTPLIATLVWTDPAGPVQNVQIADDPAPRLVNDLDIKIIAPDAFTEFLPWTLSATNPDAAAIKADNNVDNVEKVEVENASGIYTIEISHKGNLQDMLQNYTLIVSGIAESDFAITTDLATKSVCGNDVATFNIDVNSIEGFSGNISLFQTGLPPELNASFNPPVITEQGQSVLSIEGLSEVEPGQYSFFVVGNSGSANFGFDSMINILEVDPLDEITYVFLPPFSWDFIELNPEFNWDVINNAEFYELELASDSEFNDIIFSVKTDNNSVQSPELSPLTNYYVRIRAINECVSGPYFTYNFITKDAECQPLYFATDTPIAIPNEEQSYVQSVLNITDSTSIPIDDINVSLDITHSNLQDLIISLTSPAGTTITLFEDQCPDYENLEVVFDDAGSPIICDDVTNPQLTGTIKPIDDLFTFENENYDGDWTLTVENSNSNNGGTINEFAIEICYGTLLTTTSQELKNVFIYPNPTNDIVNISLQGLNPESCFIEIYDISGKLVIFKEKPKNASNFSINLEKLNSGTYLLKLQTEGRSTIKKLIKK